MASSPRNYLDKIPQISERSTGTGELSDLENNPYSYGSISYPYDLGKEYCPHYVTFNIHLPESSKYITDNPNSVSDTPSRSQENYDFTAKNRYQPQGGTTTGDKATYALGVGGLTAAAAGPGAGLGAGLGSYLARNITLRPKLKRITRSIHIYMPDTVQSQFSHSHDGVSLTDALGNLGFATAVGADLAKNAKELSSAVTQYAKDLVDPSVVANWNPNLSFNPGTAEALGKLTEKLGGTGQGFSDLLVKSLGKAVNPQVELIFRGTANREFVFDFQFQPRSEKEGQDINNIIQTFKTFAAAELSSGENGRYYIPPGQFDIKFMFGNKENPAIGKISTCVLTNITVNYSGAGAFATFVDGNPVQINMSLIFKEADIITRELIQKFGY